MFENYYSIKVLNIKEDVALIAAQWSTASRPQEKVYTLLPIFQDEV